MTRNVSPRSGQLWRWCVRLCPPLSQHRAEYNISSAQRRMLTKTESQFTSVPHHRLGLCVFIELRWFYIAPMLGICCFHVITTWRGTNSPAMFKGLAGAPCPIRSDSQTTGLPVADNWIDEDGLVRLILYRVLWIKLVYVIVIHEVKEFDWKEILLNKDWKIFY